MCNDLLRILGTSGATWSYSPVYIAVEGFCKEALAVIFVPQKDDDPLSPRIELRSGLVYRDCVRPQQTDFPPRASEE